MRITLVDKQGNLSDVLRSRMEKKIDKLSRYFPEDTEVQVKLRSERGNRQIVELTIPFHGEILRAEECSDDMYSSMDRALAKLEKQIHRNRTRFETRMRSGAFDNATPEYADSAYANAEEVPHLVRTKEFVMDPMSIEDAMETLEMLGHTFYMFRNAKDNEINVLYKRDDGNYGIIRPA